MDHNFHRLHEQIEQLEKKLAEVKARLGMQTSESGPYPEITSPLAPGFNRSFGVSSGND